MSHSRGHVPLPQLSILLQDCRSLAHYRQLYSAIKVFAFSESVNVRVASRYQKLLGVMGECVQNGALLRHFGQHASDQ